MSVRKILGFVCPLLSGICLGTGFAKTGPWIAAAVIVLSAAAWWLAVKWPDGFPPAWALVFNAGLASAGLLTGGAPLWMLLGAALALAAWDMVLWNRALAGDPASASLTLMERKHYQSLAAALGLGLAAVLAGRWVHFQVPFGWMVVLVSLALFSLERIRHMLAR